MTVEDDRRASCPCPCHRHIRLRVQRPSRALARQRERQVEAVAKELEFAPARFLIPYRDGPDRALEIPFVEEFTITWRDQGEAEHVPVSILRTQEAERRDGEMRLCKRSPFCCVPGHYGGGARHAPGLF